MTTVAGDRPPAAEPAATDAGDRGRLSIASEVVRQVAERAADTTPGTARTARTLAGVDIGAQGASASVDGEGSHVRLRMELALHYPAAVRAVVAAVRAKVAEDVERMTGYQVRGVDVVVTSLVPPTRARVE